MPTTVLGISAFYHDSAAAIVQDGEIVAAAQEERFSRRKHDAGFPRQAINYCLGEAFIEPRDLDGVIFYDNPVLTLDRVVKSFLAVAPRGEQYWMAAARSQLGVKVFTTEFIRRMLQADVPVHFTQHHLSHAASAFYPSPFERAAVLTMDGVGEWATTTIGLGEGSDLRILKELHYPHSLGLLYSAMTYFCGFKVNSGEYKLMGLAPYGTPRYAGRIREHLIRLCADGSYRLNTDYFGFLDSQQMTNEHFAELFDGPPREPESMITRREMDLAASIQLVTEEVVLTLARHARELTGATNLCLAGGWPSIAWRTDGCFAKESSTTSGSSPLPATPAGRWAPRSSLRIAFSVSLDGNPSRDVTRRKEATSVLHSRAPRFAHRSIASMGSIA